MSWRDLKLTDIRRLASVGLDLVDDGDVRDVVSKLKEAFDTKPDPPSGGLFFSNPPSPFAEEVDPMLSELIGKLRARVADRYGEDYAQEVWQRLQK